MATSQSNADESESRSVTDLIRTAEAVVWGLCTLVVAALVGLVLWGAIDLRPPVVDSPAVALLALVGVAVLGTVAFVAISVLDA